VSDYYDYSTGGDAGWWDTLDPDAIDARIAEGVSHGLDYLDAQAEYEQEVTAIAERAHAEGAELVAHAMRANGVSGNPQAVYSRACEILEQRQGQGGTSDREAAAEAIWAAAVELAGAPRDEVALARRLGSRNRLLERVRR
jgi:hypothetical protein